MLLNNMRQTERTKT